MTTNLPDNALLSASLNLANQNPDDPYIGADSPKVTVKGGKARFVVDGTKGVFPRNSKLPAGNYNVEVSFYPLWSEHRSLAAQLKVTDEIKGIAKVKLGGSGVSSSSVKEKAELNKWVMMNVNIGDSWDEDYYIKKLRNYRELTLSSGNPKILKMYYFPKIDMIFMVNIYKGEIAVWREGKAHR